MQRAQDQPSGPVGGDQPGQAVAAGDRDQAVGAAGQQRPDLVGGGRVVEQQQQSAPGRHRPGQAGRLLEVVRNLVHAEPVEQLAQRLDRLQLRGRRVATQVEVQLPSGNWSACWWAQWTAMAVLPTPAIPATTATPSVVSAWARRAREAGRRAAAGRRRGRRTRRRGRKLRRRDRRGGLGCRCTVNACWRGIQPQPRIAGQGRPLQPLQVRAGLQFQLLDQQPVALPVHLQRLGLASRAVQGQHQPLPQPLPQRMACDQGPSSHQAGVAAQGQLDLGEVLHGGQPALLQAGRLSLGERRIGPRSGPAPATARARPGRRPRPPPARPWPPGPAVAAAALEHLQVQLRRRRP